MKINWSNKGHGMPQKAVRRSDNLKQAGSEKARASRIAWERAEAGLEPFFQITQRVIVKVMEAQDG